LADHFAWQQRIQKEHMGGHRSLERSVEEGLVTHIPVNKQILAYAPNEAKDST